MKKLITLLVAIALCACLFVGCSRHYSDEYRAKYWENTGFTYIEYKGCADYVYHNDTKVMYVFIRGIEYDSTGMSVLVNTDGTPMVWEGE